MAVTSIRRIGQVLWGLAVGFAPVSLAQAGSFAVNPVRVTLSATQAIAAVTVQNAGTEPTVVQLETSSWTQHDGVDVLASTSEILATPPILTIQPGASRVVRVGLRRSPDAHHELTYRLFLREVPPPEPIAQGLRVALLVSMPIFVVPPRTPTPDVHWQALRTQDGKIRVRATNTGTSHIQLGQLDVALAADGAQLSSRSMSEYVLPDNSRAWTLDAKSVPPSGTLLSIFDQADTGKVRSEVRLEDDSWESKPGTSTAAPR
jgi:fimbrial chaperone protein